MPRRSRSSRRRCLPPGSTSASRSTSRLRARLRPRVRRSSPAAGPPSPTSAPIRPGPVTTRPTATSRCRSTARRSPTTGPPTSTRPAARGGADLGVLANGSHTLFARARMGATTSAVTSVTFGVAADARVEWQVVRKNTAPAPDGWQDRGRRLELDVPVRGEHLRLGSWTILVRRVEDGLEVARSSGRGSSSSSEPAASRRPTRIPVRRRACPGPGVALPGSGRGDVGSRHGAQRGRRLPAVPLTGSGSRTAGRPSPPRTLQLGFGSDPDRRHRSRAVRWHGLRRARSLRAPRGGAGRCDATGARHAAVQGDRRSAVRLVRAAVLGPAAVLARGARRRAAASSRDRPRRLAGDPCGHRRRAAGDDRAGSDRPAGTRSRPGSATRSSGSAMTSPPTKRRDRRLRPEPPRRRHGRGRVQAGRRRDPVRTVDRRAAARPAAPALRAGSPRARSRWRGGIAGRARLPAPLGDLLDGRLGTRTVFGGRIVRPRSQVMLTRPVTRLAAPPRKTARAAPKLEAIAPVTRPPTGVEPAKTVV